MKFLVDMNLSPRWCPVLQAEGWDTVHWSQIGSPSANDSEIMESALSERRIVLTHDLDFGAVLAATKATGKSVVQVRTQDVRPEALSTVLIPLLYQYSNELETGALLVIDDPKSRIRLLPLSRKPTL